MQASLSFTAAVNASVHDHPPLIVKKKIGDEMEVFLVCEQSLVTQVEGLEAPIILLAAGYAFNMEYPKGLQSSCNLLEIPLLGLKPKKVPSIVSNTLAMLHSD